MTADMATALHLVTAYGYPLVAAILLLASAGLPLPVGMLLLALGVVSGHSGQLDLAALAVAGTLASVVGDLLDYGIGRAGQARLPRWARRPLAGHADRLADTGRLLAGRGGLAIFVTRFLCTALATPLSLLAGASRMRLRTFLLWDVAGETVFVAGNLLLGRVLGANATSPWATAGWAALGILALLPLVSRPLTRPLRRLLSRRLSLHAPSLPPAPPVARVA